MRQHGLRSFAGEQPPVDFNLAPVRDKVHLNASPNDPHIQRARAQERMNGLCQLRCFFIKLSDNARHVADRIYTQVRLGAMRSFALRPYLPAQYTFACDDRANSVGSATTAASACNPSQSASTP